LDEKNYVVKSGNKEKRNIYNLLTEMRYERKKMIKVDIRSKNSVYITIGKWVIYIDNSTGEYIIDSWKE